MKKLEIHPDLKNFLRKHRCLNIFILNTNKYLDEIKELHHEGITDLIKNGDLQAISGGFIWLRSLAPKSWTRDSISFWGMINDEWRTTGYKK